MQRLTVIPPPVATDGQTALPGTPADPPSVRSRPPAIVVETLLWSGRDLASAMRVSLATFHRLKSAGMIGPKPIRLGAGCVRYSTAECKEWIATPRADGRLMDRKAWEAWSAAKSNGNR